jgi:hypothetical protein
MHCASPHWGNSTALSATRTATGTTLYIGSDPETYEVHSHTPVTVIFQIIAQLQHGLSTAQVLDQVDRERS